jgi:hypothetical protein
MVSSEAWQHWLILAFLLATHGALQRELRSRFHSLHAIGRIHFWRVYDRAHGEAVHFRSGIRLQQSTHLLLWRFRIQPSFHSFLRQDRRHPVVDRTHQVIRPHSDDRKRLQIIPAIPQSTEHKRPPLLQVDVDRLLAAGNLLPFEETIRQHHATPLPKGRPKSRFGRDPFRARVHKAVADLFVLRPEWDQAPA